MAEELEDGLKKGKGYLQDNLEELQRKLEQIKESNKESMEDIKIKRFEIRRINDEIKRLEDLIVEERRKKLKKTKVVSEIYGIIETRLARIKELSEVEGQLKLKKEMGDDQENTPPLLQGGITAGGSIQKSAERRFKKSLDNSYKDSISTDYEKENKLGRWSNKNNMNNNNEAGGWNDNNNDDDRSNYSNNSRYSNNSGFSNNTGFREFHGGQRGRTYAQTVRGRNNYGRGNYYGRGGYNRNNRNNNYNNNNYNQGQMKEKGHVCKNIYIYILMRISVK